MSIWSDTHHSVSHLSGSGKELGATTTQAKIIRTGGGDPQSLLGQAFATRTLPHTGSATASGTHACSAAAANRLAIASSLRERLGLQTLAPGTWEQWLDKSDPSAPKDPCWRVTSREV